MHLIVSSIYFCKTDNSVIVQFLRSYDTRTFRPFPRKLYVLVHPNLLGKEEKKEGSKNSRARF